MSGGGGSWVVENQWTCSTCGTVNPGRELRCSGCGKPKEQEAYDASGAAQAAAVGDQRLVQMAQAGVNWTCAYCQYQNRNLHDRCERCGAEKAESAAQQPQGAQTPGGTPGMPPGMTVTPIGQGQQPQGMTVTKVDPPKSKPPWAALGCLVVLLGACGLGYFLLGGREGEATVSEARWHTTTRLEQREQRQGQGFQEAMPAGAQVQSCEQRTLGTMPCNPYPCVVQGNGQCNPHECNCQNQCRDLGNGFSECQRVCETCYETCQVGQQSTCYQQCPRVGMYCRYTYDDWRARETRELSGDTGAPTFASDLVASGPSQRVVNETRLVVVFTQEGERYEYTASDLDDFRRFSVGQRWDVTTTRMGGITPVAPK